MLGIANVSCLNDMTVASPVVRWDCNAVQPEIELAIRETLESDRDPVESDWPKCNDRELPCLRQVTGLRSPARRL